MRYTLCYIPALSMYVCIAYSAGIHKYDRP